MEQSTTSSLHWVNNFWGKDDAGYHQLMQRVHNSRLTSEELKIYYKERMAIEQEYSRKLKALSHKALGSKETGGMKQALENVRITTSAAATTHETVARQISEQLLAPLSAFNGSMKSRSKTIEDTMGQLTRAKTSQDASSEKARSRYLAECNKISGFQAQQNLLMGRELDKNNQKLDKAAFQVEGFQRQYQDSLKVLAQSIEVWNAEWRASCDKLEQIEDERLTFLKSNLWAFANSISAACVADDEGCESIRTHLEKCDPAQDLEQFSREKGTGSHIQDPPEFVNFLQGFSRDSEGDEGRYHMANFDSALADGDFPDLTARSPMSTSTSSPQMSNYTPMSSPGTTPMQQFESSPYVKAPTSQNQSKVQTKPQPQVQSQSQPQAQPQSQSHTFAHLVQMDSSYNLHNPQSPDGMDFQYVQSHLTGSRAPAAAKDIYAGQPSATSARSGSASPTQAPAPQQKAQSRRSWAMPFKKKSNPEFMFKPVSAFDQPTPSSSSNHLSGQTQFSNAPQNQSQLFKQQYLQQRFQVPGLGNPPQQQHQQQQLQQLQQHSHQRSAETGARQFYQTPRDDGRRKSWAPASMSGVEPSASTSGIGIQSGTEDPLLTALEKLKAPAAKAVRPQSTVGMSAMQPLAVPSGPPPKSRGPVQRKQVGAANSLPSMTSDGRPVVKHARAQYDYRAAIPEEVTFKKGDILLVTEMQDDGWWDAEVSGRHTFGLAPSNFLTDV